MHGARPGLALSAAGQHMQRAPIAYMLAHMAHSTSPSCSSVDIPAPNARYGPRKPLFLTAHFGTQSTRTQPLCPSKFVVIQNSRLCCSMAVV